MKKLHIEKLRGIECLDFDLPEHAGAFLLTGANGAGKSTVLSCLALLGDPTALDRFFVPDICFCDSCAGDVFADCTIRFEAEEYHATYHYREGKWQVHDPESGEKTFAAFGFAGTIFTGARRKHHPAVDETFSIQDVKRAPETVAKSAAAIFDDDRFYHLHTIRSQSDGNEYFLVHRFLGGQDYYFSENNFSAGERAVLHLLSQLEKLPPSSLILIDEAEMALHPKAQKRLLDHLSDVALKQHHVILISTQSASLIRISDPRNILFLENDESGCMICRRDVYPAAILGEMAIVEDILPEIVLLVEDPEASMLLEAIMDKLRMIMDIQFPYIKIMPVGGYMQVVILMDNLSKVFPPYVKRRAVLDRDAEHHVRRAMVDPSVAHFDVVSRNRRNIYFLPCAPEQGVIRLLEQSVQKHGKALSKIFSHPNLPLGSIMGDMRYRNIGGDSRSDCKDKLTFIVRGLARITSEPEQFVRKKLYRYYVENRYRNPRELKEDYCSLIFRR